MDIGLILALIASVSFAVGIVLIRKSVGEVGKSFVVNAFTTFTGVLFFIVAIFISGEWSALTGISWRALGFLIIVGIIHFIIGRFWAYEAFRLIGANRGTPITQISTALTVVLGWLFLQETLTVYVGLGAACMLAGVFFISQEKSNPAGEPPKSRADVLKGILTALGAALCWGITPVLIRPAVQELGSSAASTFVSYAAAGVVILALLLGKKQRLEFQGLAFKKHIVPMVLAGIFMAAGQLLYFTALGKSPASVVAPLVSVEVLFIYVLSFIINRKSEVFTWKVALGMAAMVSGTFLLFR
jgi:drug/metabolite transporter (DMT)-like permease